jgi:MFS-type transporter involved in bile tolerance (Atg22 family)
MEAARLASYSTGLLGTATVLGALIVPLLAEWLGRRITLGIFVALMFFSIFLVFGHVFYRQEGAVGCSWSPPSFSG